jgi:hypothetical protein
VHTFAELTEEERKIAQDAFYSEEELKLTPRQKAGMKHRVAIADNTARWPNGTIPYEIDNSIASNYHGMINQAMNHISAQTGNCIKFVRRSNQGKYIRLVKGNGCSSWLGMYGSGVQDVNLGDGCYFSGTIIHELLHAVGFDHEQNRPDRDSYLNVYTQNVLQGQGHNFNKTPGGQTYNDFDYNSVMLYGEYAFSKQRGQLKTMEDKFGRYKLTEPYDKTAMTNLDAYQVKRFYNCNW